MKCSEAMNAAAPIVRSNDCLRVVAEVLVETKVSFLPVLNHDNELVGTVTDRQLLQHAVATGLDLFNTSALHVAKLDALTCGADDDLTAAEQKMKDAHESQIVVVGGETGKVYLGLVTQGGKAGDHAATAA